MNATGHVIQFLVGMSPVEEGLSYSCGKINSGFSYVFAAIRMPEINSFNYNYLHLIKQNICSLLIQKRRHTGQYPRSIF